jgi:hypothetical protein
MNQTDPNMPWLEACLDPRAATRALGAWLARDNGADPQIEHARLLKRRRGRRAVVAYTLKTAGDHGGPGLVGKIRARGLDRRTFRLHEDLVARGFGEESEDGISVPAPVGVVPPWRMWVQRFVPGRPLDRILPSLSPTVGQCLMRQVVRGITKLHRTPAPTRRRHTVEDELRILEERLEPALRTRADLAPAIRRIEEGCRRLAGRLPVGSVTGIHRDFHPAQLILEGDRLHLLDLDLYAYGDPALDIGNFAAHLTERGIRDEGDARALAHLEESLMDEVLRCDPNHSGPVLQSWHTLSLARHVGLSVTRSGRAHTTGLLVEEVNERLSEARALPPTSEASGRPRPPSEPSASPPDHSKPRSNRRGASFAGGGPWLAIAMLGAFAVGVQPAAGQTQHSAQVGLDVSSLYDSNIYRDRENPKGLAGVVTTGILRYRMRGSRDLRAEAEVGFHRYAESTPWDRVSHKLRVDGRQPVGSTASVGLVTELQIRGSGEDRSLGNQLSLEPSFRLEPRNGTEIRLRGVSRFRRNKVPSENETSRFLSLDLEQELTPRTDVEFEVRYEQNRSESGRRDFQGPRYGLGVTHAPTPQDEVLLELTYRERAYTDRWVDTSFGEALRQDARLTPRIRWRRSVSNLVRVSLEYDYEQRDSNDPDKILGGHLVILGARIIW